MAMGEIVAILDTTIETVHKVYNNKRERDNKYFFITK
jgi:hypothetical protein